MCIYRECVGSFVYVGMVNDIFSGDGEYGHTEAVDDVLVVVRERMGGEDLSGSGEGKERVWE